MLKTLVRFRRHELSIAASVSLATFLIYLPSLRNEFVWDDFDYVSGNPYISSLDGSFFRWAFLEFYAANWHPLTWISHAIDYAFWGLNPVGHHLTNNILHSINTFLVVLLVMRLIEAVPGKQLSSSQVVEWPGNDSTTQQLNFSPSRLTIHDSRFSKVAAALFALVILVLSSATYARNTLWSEKISLWEDTVRKSPGSTRANNNLGIAYYEKGRYDEAIKMYERAISLSPVHLNAYMNLGVVFAVTRRLDEAIEEFSAVIARDPKKSPAYLNLARAYTDLGRPHDAIENYLKLIAINPNYGSAYHGLGTTYARLGRMDEALAAFTRFVELSPHDPEAYGNRGLVYLNKGDVSSALADFQQACSLGNMASCKNLERLR